VNGALPNGSHFASTGANGGDANFPNSFAGTLNLCLGSQDANGVAPLTFGVDSIAGFRVLNGSFLCFRFEAAGSTGKVDCNGGLPVGVVYSTDSHGASPADPPTLQTEQAPPGAAGAGYIVANVHSVNCPGDPACLASFTAGAASCSDPTKVNWALSTPETRALTTGAATATVTNAVQTGTVTLTRTGVPFDCANWTTDGPGIVQMPIFGFDTAVGDTANVLQLDD
jgi:hypothetical protein